MSKQKGLEGTRAERRIRHSESTWQKQVRNWTVGRARRSSKKLLLGFEVLPFRIRTPSSVQSSQRDYTRREELGARLSGSSLALVPEGPRVSSRAICVQEEAALRRREGAMASELLKVHRKKAYVARHVL